MDWLFNQGEGVLGDGEHQQPIGGGEILYEELVRLQRCLHARNCRRTWRDDPCAACHARESRAQCFIGRTRRAEAVLQTARDANGGSAAIARGDGFTGTKSRHQRVDAAQQRIGFSECSGTAHALNTFACVREMFKDRASPRGVGNLECLAGSVLL